MQTFVAEPVASCSYDPVSPCSGRCAHSPLHCRKRCAGRSIRCNRSRPERFLVQTQAKSKSSGTESAKAKAKGSSTESAKQETDFQSSRDISKVLLGGQWMEGLRGRWLSFAEQASSPTSMLSGAATATAAVLLAFPFHSSFPDKIAKIMASRPADVSPEVWLLAIALTSLVPAAIYVGMTWRVLHKMKNGTRETDQAVAVVAALSVKNAATIENFMTLLDGLENHPSIGSSVVKMRDATKKQLDLQEVLFSKMVVRSEPALNKHLQHAVQAAAGDLDKANISVAEACALLDYEKAEAMPTNSLTYKIDKYDKILALMLLRQRGMRLTIISILDDLAVKLPPLRPSIQQVRQQFASRFKHEDTMMQQITPPGFNAAEKVRHLLHSHDMVTNLAASGLKPEDVMGSLLGPWGASSPQTDLKRHEMEKLLTTTSADSSETRSAKQELEKLLNLTPAADDVKQELNQAPTDKKPEGPDTS